MSGYRVDFDTLEWESPMKGLRFKAVSSGGRRLRMVEYTPEMELHWCEKGHIGFVLDGAFEIKYDNETIIYKAGEGVFIPPGKEHRHMGKALTDVVRVVFVEEV
ncbi:MAG: cupin domain-containing protein [Candidatus Latescibacterota bacterium]|nr:MAG: cupin domain-containing protein [Candidatus Latescibacterota bacterium]